MSSWPPLVDETERLHVLSTLDAVGLEPEERFARITRMATRDLAVPIAAVSLIDDQRQRFKAAIGLESNDLPREQAICADTLAGQGVLVVPDLRADPRFRDYPTVTGPPHAQSYAGLPLVVAGRRVGTLCVLDTRVRSFDADELAALIDLGAWAESELLGEQSRRVVRELDELQRHTERVLAGVAEGVIGVDAQGRVTFANGAAEQLLGWPQHGLTGQELHRTVHSRHGDGRPYPPRDCPVSDTLRTGRERRLLREVFWRRDGRPLPVDWSSGAVQDGPEVVGAVVVFEDATRRVEVDRLKDEFVSVVSHELRTPLTSLRAALDLLVAGLLGDGAGPDAHRLVTIAHTNAGRLARLVDDILDLESSSRGAMPLTRGPVEVAQLMKASLETVQGTADCSEVAVHLGDGTGEVWGDEHRLVQVLTNLLGNAIRFSRPGSTVRLGCDSDDWGLRLTVADQGMGIPVDVQDRVFERFWQVDGSDSRARSGTGLGLAIAKNIVEAHGGYLTLDSTPGVGSTFTVCLPQRRAGHAGSQDDRDYMDRLAVPVDRRRRREPAGYQQDTAPPPDHE